MYFVNDLFTSSATESYSCVTESSDHGMSPASISFFNGSYAEKYTESVSPYITDGPT